MGGAERTERKKRQQKRSSGASAVAQARGKRDTRITIAIISVVAVVAIVVIGGITWTAMSKNETEGEKIPTAEPVSSEYPERRDGVVAVSGAEDAPVTIDVYADFLCPACAAFEQQYGPQIEELVAQGELQLRTHMVPMLTDRSNPPGYSLESANAALLAADEGKFTAFHDSLFASQPEMGKRAYDKDQLITLGRDLGITSEAFAEGIREGKYDDQLMAEMQRVSEDPSLHQDRGTGQPGFGTPTVVANGSLVDLSDPQWLDKLTSKSAS